MEGLKTESNFGSLSNAQVIGYDSEHNSVYIQLPSGQSPMFPARMLYLGCADGIRVHQMPLPIIGTWGLVAFPSGDDRYPIWLGGYYPNNNINAITTDANLQSSQVDYYSHASGYYSLLDYVGQQYIRFPDGTSLNISDTNTQPETFYHGVQAQATGVAESYQDTPQRIQMTDAFRVPNPPSPFWINLQHPSGASLTVSPSGTVNINAGNQQVPSIVMTPSGIITISTTPSGGQTQGPQIILNTVSGDVFINGQQGNSQIHMDSSGNVTINGAGNIAVNGGGNIAIQAQGSCAIIADGGDTVLDTSTHVDSVNQIINTFNVHTHQNVQSGQGNSGPPNQILT